MYALLLVILVTPIMRLEFNILNILISVLGKCAKKYEKC